MRVHCYHCDISVNLLLRQTFIIIKIPGLLLYMIIKKRLQCFLLGIFLLIFPILKNYSQDISFSGKVIDAAARHPISGASIVLIETGQQKNSDDNGHFIFDRLDPGRFSISVRHIAFTGIERTIILTPGQNHLSTLRGLIKYEPGRNFYLNATMAI